MFIHFEQITPKTIYIAVEIVNSNPSYNQLENGKEKRTLRELEKEFLSLKTKSMFIKLDDTYIGIIDFMEKNPRDQLPWIGLFMIHRDYQSYGFGTQAYMKFESNLQSQGIRMVHIGVLIRNLKAKTFWELLNFKPYKVIKMQNGQEIICYEKYFDKNG